MQTHRTGNGVPRTTQTTPVPQRGRGRRRAPELEPVSDDADGGNGADADGLDGIDDEAPTAPTPVPARRGRGRQPAAAAVATPTGNPFEIKIPDLPRGLLRISVVGTTAMVLHAFSDKTRTQMAEAQSGAARRKKDAKVPFEEYRSAIHADREGRCCIPVMHFKGSMIAAVRSLEGATMTTMKGAFFVGGDTRDGEHCIIYTADGEPYRVPAKAPTDTEPLPSDCPAMRTDMVRVGPMKTADIRYRPEFEAGWTCMLAIDFDPTHVSVEQLVFLLRVAGNSWGAGDMRPGKSGHPLGRFDIVPEGIEVERLR